MTVRYDETIMKLQRAAERTEQAQNARPARSGLQRAMGNATETLSRRAAARREAGICNAALHRLVDLCYEQVDGQFCNIDPDSGRILIPMPTGRKRYAEYGLTSTHQKALRVAMLAWASDASIVPLFYYAATPRRWYLCTGDYPRLELALRWLNWRQMTAAMWLNGGAP